MKPNQVSAERPRVAVFLHSGDYDRMHEGLSIAAAAVASGRRADLFFFWWALERLAQDKLDEPDLVPPREDVVNRFETRNVPTLRSLLSFLRESGDCTVYACTGSLAIVGLAPSALEGKAQFVGWSTILQLTAGVTDRFFL
jgi:peroxiredoxin family protein